MTSQEVIDKLNDYINNNQELKEIGPVFLFRPIESGRSDAKVLKVICGSKKRLIGILKINEKDEKTALEAVLATLMNDPTKSKLNDEVGNYLAKILCSYELELDEKRMFLVLYEMSGDKAAQTLMDLILDSIRVQEYDNENKTIIEKIFDGIVDFDKSWRSSPTEYSMTPAEMIIRELGVKYQDKKFKEAYASLKTDTKWIIPKGYDKSLPNPCKYIEMGEEWGSIYPFFLSSSHNDFHAGNIIIQNGKPVIIDFAEYKVESNIYYDLMYLEFHILFDYFKQINLNKMNVWANYCEALSDAPKSIFDIKIKGLEAAGTLGSLIHSLRSKMRPHVEHTEVEEYHLLTAAVSVGLNVMRRSAKIEEREAAFVYAAFFMKALRNNLGIKDRCDFEDLSDMNNRKYHYDLEQTPTKKMPNEVYAIELLEKPVVIERNDDEFTVIIDRSGTHEIIINNKTKNSRFSSELKENREKLNELDKELFEFFARKTGKETYTLDLSPYGVKFRWASGGGVPIVRQFEPDGTVKKSIALFFRDIAPVGWNIALGGSQRNFDFERGTATELEDELENPTKISRREFMEELLILSESLDDIPMECREPINRNYRVFSYSEETNYPKFIKRHIGLRRDPSYDNLILSPSKDRIKLETLDTNMELIIKNRKGTEGEALYNILVVPDIVNFGIEIVKLFQFDLKNDDYILDGEIMDGEIKDELVRMPVALIDLDYIKEYFKSFDRLKVKFTNEEKKFPSIIVEESSMKLEDHIKVFQWDVNRRKYIKDNKERGIGSEFVRYKNWFNGYGPNFDPENFAPSRLFTPATAKTLNLMIIQGII